jgi:pimeloyl-ACP methyl ester carboxylesterase
MIHEVPTPNDQHADDLGCWLRWPWCQIRASVGGHSIGTILAVAVCAVLAEGRSFTAIGEVVASASDQLLGTPGCPARRPSRRWAGR